MKGGVTARLCSTMLSLLANHIEMFNSIVTNAKDKTVDIIYSIAAIGPLALFLYIRAVHESTRNVGDNDERNWRGGSHQELESNRGELCKC
jgi:hypothetical protein